MITQEVFKACCKYCGSEYSYTSSKITTVYSINEYDFNPKIKSRLHDTINPMICNMCGAEVLLGYVKLKSILNKRKRD
jgi:hypothetical protein